MLYDETRLLLSSPQVHACLSVLLTLSGCGRIGFDYLEADVIDGGDVVTEPISIAPPGRINVNASVDLVASGGAGGYSFSIAWGEGRVDPASGRFTAPNYAGDTSVRVTDAAGEKVEVNVVAGGSSLFAMGGWGGYTTDKVYNSSDGVAWTVDNLEISRGETVTVVFKDQLFMTGGWYSGSNIASVLTSTSGATGTWTTAGDLPAPRGWGSAVVFEDRIIYVGGRSPTTWANPEVYASSDGASWSQIGSLPQSSTWGGLAVFQGALWHLGGDHDSDGISDAIYRSEDGVSWEIAPETLPEARAGGAVFVHRNALWYIGGADASGTVQDQIWRSTDGRVWSDTGNKIPAALKNPASTVHNSKIWITGGNNGSYVNTVYKSLNGVEWVRAADLPETLDRFSSVSFTPK